MSRKRKRKANGVAAVKRVRAVAAVKRVRAAGVLRVIRDVSYTVYWKSGQKATYSGFEILLALDFFAKQAKVILDARSGAQIFPPLEVK